MKINFYKKIYNKFIIKINQKLKKIRVTFKNDFFGAFSFKEIFSDIFILLLFKRIMYYIFSKHQSHYFFNLIGLFFFMNLII